MELIDSTKAIKSDLNSTKREIEHNKETLKEKEEELKQYSFLPVLEKELKNLEDLEFQIYSNHDQLNKINAISNNLQEIDNKLIENKKLLNLKSLVTDVLQIQLKLKNSTRQKSKN